MEFNKRSKMTITGVYDKETRNPDEKYSYRIGRQCYLQNELKIGEPISWKYENGLICTSPYLEDFEEDEYGVFITTGHRVYDFEYDYDGNIEDEEEVEDKEIIK